MNKRAVLCLLAVVIIESYVPAQPSGNPGTAEAAAPVRESAIVVRCANTLSDAGRINEAISASPEGAEIVICGECLIDRTIRLLQNRSYRGQSRSGTVLKQADGANLIALLASSGFLENNPYTDGPVYVSHLQLNGNRKNNTETPTAGLILRSWLSVVEDMHIRNMGGDGLRLTNCSENRTGLQTTQVNGRITNNFITHSGGHGIHIEDTQNAVTDWILCDNWIASSGKDGIHMDNAAGWYVERNHIYGVPQNAIHAERLWASSISDNYIEGFGEGDTAGTWHGIYASIQGGAASTIADNRIMNFREEKHESSLFRYLSLRVRYDTGMVVVTGNSIRSKGVPRGTGLYYDAPVHTRLVVTSCGNVIRDVIKKRHVGVNVILDGGL
jgi:hypothetical protein